MCMRRTLGNSVTYCSEVTLTGGKPRRARHTSMLRITVTNHLRHVLGGP